jgi:NAD(P)-dependent dehydrogenase (short-subunit alcohol dehydrogenase family)
MRPRIAHNAAMYEVPDQSGRLAVITGSNSGLGQEAARRLAGAGARVLLAVRSVARGEQARDTILSEFPGAWVEVRQVDLARLASVKEFADRLLTEGTTIDLLLNNAAVMAAPTRLTTADGFELQFGTNFLGPFALTLQLLPLLLAAPAPRVVTMSSSAARFGRIQLDDLQAELGYRPMAVYGQSKLADLMFARRLAGVAADRGWNLVSNAAHPGYTRTNLISNGAALRQPGGKRLAMHVLARIPHPVQGVRTGVEPLLYAATSPDAVNGGYYGPQGPLEMAGPVGAARVPRHARDADVATRLWSIAELLAGVTLPPAPGSSKAEPTEAVPSEAASSEAEPPEPVPSEAASSEAEPPEPAAG